MSASAFDPDPPGKLPPSFWLTRGRKCGTLCDRIEIWAVEPERIYLHVDGDVIWSPPLDRVDQQATLLGSWSVAEAHMRMGNGIPDDDKQCVRSGPRYLS